MKPLVIAFNGLGQPRQKHVVTGHVAILVQGEKKEAVRIELPTPGAYSPTLHHATNPEALHAEIAQYWRSLDVSELTRDRDWVIECPAHISQKATFEEAPNQ